MKKIALSFFIFMPFSASASEGDISTFNEIQCTGLVGGGFGETSSRRRSPRVESKYTFLKSWSDTYTYLGSVNQDDYSVGILARGNATVTGMERNILRLHVDEISRYDDPGPLPPGSFEVEIDLSYGRGAMGHTDVICRLQ